MTRIARVLALGLLIHFRHLSRNAFDIEGQDGFLGVEVGDGRGVQGLVSFGEGRVDRVETAPFSREQTCSEEQGGQQREQRGNRKQQ